MDFLDQHHPSLGPRPRLFPSSAEEGSFLEDTAMNPKTIKFVLFAWILGLSLLIAVPLHAQVAGATLSGTIADAMGAAVPNATVSVTNTATGVVVSITTNPVGAYTVPNLNAGEYRVIASAPGFGATAANLTLTV